MATNRLPISRFSVKFILVVGSWDNHTEHPPVLRHESRSICRAIWKRMTPFKLKCKKKHNVLLSLNPSEGFTTELLCSLTNYWASFSKLPPYGVTKCLAVLCTTKAFPLPLCYQLILVISTTWIDWKTPLPGIQPPWAVGKGPADLLDKVTKHSFCLPYPLNSSTCQLSMAAWLVVHLIPQNYLLSPHH